MKKQITPMNWSRVAKDAPHYIMTFGRRRVCVTFGGNDYYGVIERETPTHIDLIDTVNGKRTILSKHRIELVMEVEE